MAIINECLHEYEVERGSNIGNFLAECYNPKTANKANIIPITETNAKRLIDKHSQNGYVIVSPCRGGADFGLDKNKLAEKEKLANINKQRITDCLKMIKQSGFAYTPSYGGFIENQGEENEENVYERSFIIYNHYRDGSVGNFEDLFNLAMEICRKYNQDSVLVKAPGKNPKYIKQDGSLDFSFSDNVAFNDISQQYFTDLHKNTDKFSNINDRKPTRFSFLESYINPAPQCYGERISRARNGEIFLS